MTSPTPRGRTRDRRRGPPWARWVTLSFLPLLALLALSGSQTAWAGCGGVQVGQPQHHIAPGLPPLAVGDSSMLLALPELTAEGFAVNAHGCRQFPEALALLTALANAHQLPHLVVVALGADGSVTPGDVSATLQILGPTRMLVLVTPRELGGGSGSDATTVRDAGSSYPTRIRVLDWVAFSAGQGSWFQPDGLHLTFAGAAAFARLLATALPLGAPSPTAITLTTHHAPGGRVRIQLTPGWQLLSHGPHNALLRPPGRCGYRITFSVIALPTSKRSTGATRSTAATEVKALAPPGVALGRVGTGAGGNALRTAWLTWRKHATPVIGGTWATPRSPRHGFLVLKAHSTVAAGCSIGVAHQVRAALFAVLADARPT